MSHLIRLFNPKGNSQNYALVKPEHVYRQVENSDGYRSSEDAVESIVITERKGRVLSHIERLLWLSVVALLSVTLVVRLAAERSQRDCLRNMSSYELGFASDLGEDPLPQSLLAVMRCCLTCLPRNIDGTYSLEARSVHFRD